MKNSAIIAVSFAMATLLSPQVLQAQLFSDQSTQAGLNHLFEVPDIALGGAAAVIDYNNDGFEDLYLIGGTAPDKLYHNNGDGTFTDVAVDAGFSHLGTILTLGVTVGDVDNDGHRDIFITTRCNVNDLDTYVPNLLYMNNGDGTFTDRSSEYGIDNEAAFSTAAVFGDINLDGYLDLYVSNFFHEDVYSFTDTNGVFDVVTPRFTGRSNRVYINSGMGAYIDRTELYAIYDSSVTWQAVLSDADNDGDPDIYLANDFGWELPANRLYINEYPLDGFTDQSVQSGTDAEMAGMGISVGDFNNDGWMDYYVTNSARNRLFKNNKDGTFEEVSENSGTKNSVLIVPSHFGCIVYKPDVNYVGNDTVQFNACDSLGQTCLQLSIIVKVRMPNQTLLPDSFSGQTGYVEIYRNDTFSRCPQFLDTQGNPRWYNIVSSPRNGQATLSHKMGLVSVGWGTNWIDYDLDGDLDLFIANGAVVITDFGFSPDNPNSLYENLGNETFQDRSVDAGVNDVYMARGSVQLDYDNDGDEDLLVLNHRYPVSQNVPYNPNVKLYRNENTSGNWIKLKLTGTQSNRDAIGARVTAYANGGIQIREIQGGSSTMSQISSIVHFGFGSTPNIDSMHIKWPGAGEQTVIAPEINRLHEITEESEATSIEYLTSDRTAGIILQLSGSERDQVLLSSDNAGQFQVRLYDVAGKCIANKHVSYSQAPYKEPLIGLLGDHIASGNYFLKVTDDRGRVESIQLNHTLGR